MGQQGPEIYLCIGPRQPPLGPLRHYLVPIMDDRKNKKFYAEI
jgi:hypothetical protein